MNILPDSVYQGKSALHHFNLELMESLSLITIFTYPKRDLSQPRPIGGSCPIAYALKHLENLNLTVEQRIVFFRYVSQCIHYFNQCLKRDCHIDYIIPMPSSCELTQHVAILLSRCFQRPMISIFEKKNISMKSIPLEQRNQFNPLILNAANSSDFTGKTVLLVDDLVATGSTLTNANHLMKMHFNDIQTIAFSLFKTEC